MSTPRIVNIEFNEELHEYHVNGRKADISVTALIDKQISKTEWHTIPADVLQKAADYGTAVHLDLELFVRDGKTPEFNETKNFQKFLKSNPLATPRTEFRLALEHRGLLLTGTADLMAYLNMIPIIADYKTTSVIYEESVRWQMSLLDYMARKLHGAIVNGSLFEYTPAQKLFVFHFDKKKQGQFTPVEVAPISDIEIERMLDAEAAGQEYVPTTFITPRLQQEVLSIQAAITKHKKAIAELEAQDDALRAGLLTAFEAHPDIKRVECPEFTISYVAPSQGTAFDAKAFEAAHPDQALNYQKTTSRKGYVTIKLKEGADISVADSTSAALPPVPKPAPTKRSKAKQGYFD